MKTKRVLTVKLPLVDKPNAKQQAMLDKGNAILGKHFARPENRALILELAGCFARAAVNRMIEEQTKKPASRPNVKRQRRRDG
jgi:hypothetical protein